MLSTHQSRSSGTPGSPWKPEGREADQKRLTQMKVNGDIESFPLQKAERSKNACSEHLSPALVLEVQTSAIMQENTGEAESLERKE